MSQRTENSIDMIEGPDSRKRFPQHSPSRSFRYYDLIMAAFVTVLLCTNLISASKQVSIGGFIFGAGVLFFPISYLFGDILTEVYGYARSRKVVWAGFGALIFASFMTQVVLRMPPAPNWQFRVQISGQLFQVGKQEAWEQVFGGTWRIVLASMLGFFAGEFANSFTLAKMKLFTRGRFLWTRTIGSTIVGEAADSIIFYPIAFLGIWSNERVVLIMITNYCLKVGWEVLATPLTYTVVGFLKRAEHEDYYDYDTSFTPFSLET
jgi:queuosine precursor transporter